MALIQRPCINCGALIPSGSYCGRCQPNYSPQRLRGRKWMRKRSAVFNRSGGMCEHCHQRIASEVHHIDGDPANNRMSNLLAVDRDCHLALEARR